MPGNPHGGELDTSLAISSLDYYTNVYGHPSGQIPTLRATSMPLGGSLDPHRQNYLAAPHPMALHPPESKVIKAIKNNISASNPWDDLKIIGTQVHMPAREISRKNYSRN
ncbi:unnamed protein product [Phytomonas sp. EM1]|nr:unnamed protein product [Phytomonas sp. EM1]|eukprot:CCW59565.1 unnamed protein product [Phytomonas sp. isolate EM1]